MNIFVGCSSRDEIPSLYIDECNNVLDKLFSYKYKLVFGACGKGLMGTSYNNALKHNCEIIGIYPSVYEDEARELEGQKIVVNTVSERTDKVVGESDILLFLPGGIGTIYELLTAIESKRANEHNKAILVYNCFGFYDNLLMQLEKMYDELFMSDKDKKTYLVFDDSEKLIDYINKSIWK